ncbi:MAG: hypothetical protein OXF02_08215 [Simkaniaceae bacterium]|nr:hypothetical protein [Simkaniaceae bacterium]
MRNFIFVCVSALLLFGSLRAEGENSLREGEKPDRELFLFTEEVFHSLRGLQDGKALASYEHSRYPVIQKLAAQFAAFLQQGKESSALQDPVSELGRLIKCAGDEAYQLPFSLERKELKEKAQDMEKILGLSLPADSDYHKLMMESLAEKRWDMALYAYIKIAESRAK